MSQPTSDSKTVEEDDTMMETPNVPIDDETYAKSHDTTIRLISTIQSILQPPQQGDKHTSSTSTANSNSNSFKEIQTTLFQSIPSSFLTLKSTNRNLTHQCYLQYQTQIQSKRKELQNQYIQLQNLIYEKSHLEREIRDCRQQYSFLENNDTAVSAGGGSAGDDNAGEKKKNYLLLVAKEELGLLDNDGDNNKNIAEDKNNGVNNAVDAQDKQKEASESNEDLMKEVEDQNNDEDDEEDNESKLHAQNDAIINSFFRRNTNTTNSNNNNNTPTISYLNPTRHQFNISKLMNAITQRGKLNNQVIQTKKRKLYLQQEYQKEMVFLNDVPKQMEKLELWSLPIQEYFDKRRKVVLSNDNDDDENDIEEDDKPSIGGAGIELLIGSQRNDRLQHAQELSGPLYNLFIQFQSFLDVHCTKKSVTAKTSKHQKEDDEYEEYEEVYNDDDNDIQMNDEENNNKDEKTTHVENDIQDIQEWKIHVVNTSTGNTNAINDVDSKEEANTRKVREYVQSDDKAIQLWIPIPNVTLTSSSSSSSSSSTTSKSSSTTKIEYVKLQFEYLPKLQLITVHIVVDDIRSTSSASSTTTRTGNKNTLSTSLDKIIWSNLKSSSSSRTSSGGGDSNSVTWLLHDLFRNDNGNKLPHGCGATLCFDIDRSDDDDENKKEAEGDGDKKELIDTKEEEVEEITEEMETLVDYDDDDNDYNNDDVNELELLGKKPTKGEILLKEITSTLLYQQSTVPRCYQWCQYLAGLHYPRSKPVATTITTTPATTPASSAPGDAETRTEVTTGTTSQTPPYNEYRIYPTTKLTMMKLNRRIRSHATLTAILRMLLQGSSKSPSMIPIHPSMEDSLLLSSRNSISTKVDKWSEDRNLGQSSSSSSPTTSHGGADGERINQFCKHYNVVLKRKSKTLNINVKIDPKYPAVPPTWSLQSSSTKAIDGHLNQHDTNLGTIEADVNTLKDASRFYNDDVEESYDWILLHQLHFIMYSWDCYQQQASNKGKKQEKSHDVGVQVGQGLQRERDRRSVDHLNFGLYRRGL